METFSILDQILNNRKTEEFDNLDAVEIINNLFSELTERERDVLVRRHGLHTGKKETLESIGAAHGLTRERIRQIETSSIKKLQQLQRLEKYLSNLRNIIHQLLEAHGGILHKGYLLDILTGFSLGGFKAKEGDREIHKNYLNFMVTRLLYKEFEEIMSSQHFKDSYKLKYLDLGHLEELAAEIIEMVEKAQKTLTTEEIIEMLKELPAHAKHEDKMKGDPAIDVAKVLCYDLFEEHPELVNNHKPHYSVLKAMKGMDQNKFGHWGLDSWRDIRPKTINDKINLVLRHSEQPMHFAEIADRINGIGFDRKKANAATVHNELILDPKYVLVGRGLYGLKDWGYKKGTVADVIEELLIEAAEPLSREEIIERVLARRLVKKATIVLALMNREKFEKVDGKYSLRQS